MNSPSPLPRRLIEAKVIENRGVPGYGGGEPVPNPGDNGDPRLMWW